MQPKERSIRSHFPNIHIHVDGPRFFLDFADATVKCPNLKSARFIPHTKLAYRMRGRRPAFRSTEAKRIVASGFLVEAAAIVPN